MENRIRWNPNESRLPIKTIKEGSLIGGVLAILFGGSMSAFFIYYLVTGIIKSGFYLGWTIFFLVIISIFLGILLLGIGQFLHNETTEITSKYIVYFKRGIFGSQQWQEVISNYDGVMKGMQLNSRTSNQFVVRLHHINNEDRDVILWLNSKGEGRDEAQIKFARLLNVPVIVKEDGNIISKKAEDFENN